jgi:acyl-CoA thioesterase I
VLLAACGDSASTASPSPTIGPPVTRDPQIRLRYVALGDSFTIGTSVTEPERWPDQLVGRVPSLDLVANLGVNGFTTRDVIAVELPQLQGLNPEFVSLLIGVNDLIQGVSEEEYRRNLNLIIDEVGGRIDNGRIVMVSTPDYTVTPAGADYGDPVVQAAKIRAYNAIFLEVAKAREILVIDIHGISLGAATDRGLVASDGLHPSGAQYTRWVDVIAPAVEALIGH